MADRRQGYWLVAVGIGLVGGLMLGGYWPHTPLHAVATDRADTFAMATGALDTEVEAVYLLDFLTGDLKALVLGKQAGTFSGFFERNVAADMGIDPQRSPKFLITTGIVNMRPFGGTRVQAGTALCYVAEITSGKIAAYAVPWTSSMFASGQKQAGAMIPINIARFRTVAGTVPAGHAVVPK